MSNQYNHTHELPMKKNHLVEEEILLPGWPGYRTRPGRSGLDWIDTQYEVAHMTGVFLRQLFTGSWLRSETGPHPLIILIVGFALIFSFPGHAETCPAILLTLIILIMVETRKRGQKEQMIEAREIEEIMLEQDDLPEHHTEF